MDEDDAGRDARPYHGGAIAGARETCGAIAAWSNHGSAKGTRASTVGLSIQYIGPCKRSDLICRATTTWLGKELISIDIVAHAILTCRIVL